ncbi:hypothetical protein SLS54_009589 [Diplodia seriata]
MAQNIDPEHWFRTAFQTMDRPSSVSNLPSRPVIARLTLKDGSVATVGSLEKISRPQPFFTARMYSLLPQGIFTFVDDTDTSPRASSPHQPSSKVILCGSQLTRNSLNNGKSMPVVALTHAPSATLPFITPAAQAAANQDARQFAGAVGASSEKLAYLKFDLEDGQTPFIDGVLPAQSSNNAFSTLLQLFAGSKCIQILFRLATPNQIQSLNWFQGLFAIRHSPRIHWKSFDDDKKSFGSDF